MTGSECTAAAMPDDAKRVVRAALAAGGTAGEGGSRLALWSVMTT